MQNKNWLRLLLGISLSVTYSISKPLDLQMGTRGFGMGGAFVAIANDASATYWNPAGLPQIKGITFSETNWLLKDISGLNVNYFNSVFPISGVGVLAGGWLMQYANLEEGNTDTYKTNNWVEHDFSLAGGRELWDNLLGFQHTSIGVSINRYVLSSGNDNGAGTGFDLGFLTQFPYGFRFGIAGHSLGADMMGDKIEPELRYGLGYIWSNAHHQITVATDIANKKDVEYTEGINGVASNYKGFGGLEYGFSKDNWSIFVRGGANSIFQNSRDNMLFTGGLGFNFSGVAVQYAFQTSQSSELSLGQTHRFTVEIGLDEILKATNPSTKSK